MIVVVLDGNGDHRNGGGGGGGDVSIRKYFVCDAHTRTPTRASHSVHVVSAGQLRVRIDFPGTAAAPHRSHWVSDTRTHRRSRRSRRSRNRRSRRRWRWRWRWRRRLSVEPRALCTRYSIIYARVAVEGVVVVAVVGRDGERSGERKETAGDGGSRTCAYDRRQTYARQTKLLRVRYRSTPRPSPSTEVARRDESAKETKFPRRFLSTAGRRVNVVIVVVVRSDTRTITIQHQLSRTIIRARASPVATAAVDDPLITHTNAPPHVPADIESRLVHISPVKQLCKTSALESEIAPKSTTTKPCTTNVVAIF